MKKVGAETDEIARDTAARVTRVNEEHTTSDVLANLPRSPTSVGSSNTEMDEAPGSHAVDHAEQLRAAARRSRQMVTAMKEDETLARRL